MRATFRVWSIVVSALALAAIGAASCRAAEAELQEAAPVPAPAEDTPGEDRPAQDPPAAQPAVDPDVDRVLRLAEQAGEKVELLDAEFDYEYNQTLIEEREWQAGRMVYKKPSSIYIEMTDGAKDVYKFDGRVYVELRTRQKQRYTHILRKPTDPPVSILDVEQLPFPHPFGQKRKHLLENYDVTYKGLETLGPWPRPEGTKPTEKESAERYEHLVLVPKPKSPAAKEYVRIEYWLDRESGLVRQARTEDKSERILTIRFKKVKLNDKAKVKDDLFERGGLPSGWQDNPPIDHTEEAGGPEGSR